MPTMLCNTLRIRQISSQPRRAVSQGHVNRDCPDLVYDWRHFSCAMVLVCLPNWRTTMTAFSQSDWLTELSWEIRRDTVQEDARCLVVPKISSSAPRSPVQYCRSQTENSQVRSF
jgi:hypothetical protein